LPIAEPNSRARLSRLRRGDQCLDRATGCVGNLTPERGPLTIDRKLSGFVGYTAEVLIDGGVELAQQRQKLVPDTASKKTRVRVARIARERQRETLGMTLDLVA
jgi:hypothetical protein